MYHYQKRADELRESSSLFPGCCLKYQTECVMDRNSLLVWGENNVGGDGLILTKLHGLFSHLINLHSSQLQLGHYHPYPRHLSQLLSSPCFQPSYSLPGSLIFLIIKKAIHLLIKQYSICSERGGTFTQINIQGFVCTWNKYKINLFLQGGWNKRFSRAATNNNGSVWQMSKRENGQP